MRTANVPISKETNYPLKVKHFHCQELYRKEEERKNKKKTLIHGRRKKKTEQTNKKKKKITIESGI